MRGPCSGGIRKSGGTGRAARDKRASMQGSQHLRWSFVLATGALALAIGLGAGGIAPGKAPILGLMLVLIVLWGTAVVPNYFASLLLFSVVLIFGLAPAEVVFAGFSSAAIWLIVSGFVIGSAISSSGLGARLAAVIGLALGNSYPRIIIGLMLVAMALGFLMPSSVGRAVVLVPIGMAIADRAGFEKGSQGRIGIAVLLAIACNMPSFAILTSNIPNVVLAGAAETVQGVRLGYLDYLMLHYPVLGVVKAGLVVGVVLWLFPARSGSRAQVAQDSPATRTSAADASAQVRVAVLLAVTLAFWATDSLHGLNPAWVGLVAATMLLAPLIGAVTPAAFKASADFGLLLFVVGALALGSLVNQSGLGADIGRVLEAILPLAPGQEFTNFLSLVAMSSVTGVFTTTPAVPSILTPMAGDLARLTGLDVPAVLMTQVVGFSTVFLPYQVAPLVVAMQLSGERLGHLTRVTLIVAAVTVLVLIPMDYLWWRVLGWI